MKSFIQLAILLGVIASLDGRGFRCDYKFFQNAQGYVKLHRKPANWKDARLRCHLEGAKIASPLDQNLKAAIISMMNFSGKLKDNSVFTGIHATFSKGDFFSAEGVPLSKIPQTWAEGQPDNNEDNESCILMNKEGAFSDVNCSDTYPYLCYKKTDHELTYSDCGTTDREYNMDMRTGSCYKFHTVPRTWSRAYMTCAAEGGHLAIINSETEAQVIKDLFAKYPADTMLGYFWKDVAFLGFQDWGEHGEWLTINGDTLKQAGYDKFSTGAPDNSTTGEFCGATYRTGLLNDLWCGNPYAFICEKDPKSLTCEQ